MKKDVVTIIICAMCIFASLAVGFGTGILHEKNNITEAKKANTDKKTEASKVAIVNMDEGVKKAEAVVNYGTTMLSSLPIDYVVTGLEDARNGLLTSKYNSYIIIPTTFSQAVESINGQPRQAAVEYAISTALDSKDREAAIYSVQDVYNTLNNNLSEIYMATILGQFHSMQDSAKTVMDNDLRDMELLEAVNGYDLTEFIELPELKVVENNIAPLNLETEFGQNTAVLASIDESYKTSLQEGQTEFEVIKGQSETVNQKNAVTKTAIDSAAGEMTAGSMQEYDDSTLATEEDSTFTAKKNGLLDDSTGYVKLYNKNNVEKYNEELRSFSTSLKDTISRYDYIEEQYRSLLNALEPIKTSSEEKEMPYIKDEDGNLIPDPKLTAMVITYKLNSTTKSTAADYQTVNAEIARHNADAANAMTVYYNGQQGSRDAIAAILQEMDTKLAEKGEASQLPASYTDWGAYVNSMFSAPAHSDCGIVTADSSARSTLAGDIEVQVPKEEVVGPAYDKDTESYLALADPIETDTIADSLDGIITQAEAGRSARNEEIGKRTNTYKSRVDAVTQNFIAAELESVTLTGKITGYNLLSFIKENDLKDYNTQLSRNSSEIEGKISTQNGEYEKYVGEVTTAASENTSLQLESIQKGQEASDKKLEDGLSDAKTSRNKNQTENYDLMHALTQQLAYTRVGGVENREVYNIMSNPVTLQNKSAVFTDSSHIDTVKAASSERETMSSGEWKLFIPIAAVLAAGIIIAAALARKRKLAVEF